MDGITNLEKYHPVLFINFNAGQRLIAFVDSPGIKDREDGWIASIAARRSESN